MSAKKILLYLTLFTDCPHVLLCFCNRIRPGYIDHNHHTWTTERQERSKCFTRRFYPWLLFSRLLILIHPLINRAKRGLIEMPHGPLKSVSTFPFLGSFRSSLACFREHPITVGEQLVGARVPKTLEIPLTFGANIGDTCILIFRTFLSNSLEF